VKLLADRGVLVSYAAASGQPLAVDALQLIGKHLTVKGSVSLPFHHYAGPSPTRGELVRYPAPSVARTDAGR